MHIAGRWRQAGGGVLPSPSKELLGGLCLPFWGTCSIRLLGRRLSLPSTSPRSSSWVYPCQAHLQTRCAGTGRKAPHTCLRCCAAQASGVCSFADIFPSPGSCCGRLLILSPLKYVCLSVGFSLFLLSISLCFSLSLLLSHFLQPVLLLTGALPGQTAVSGLEERPVAVSPLPVLFAHAMECACVPALFPGLQPPCYIHLFTSVF